jgi:sugar-specific transcriptional regulator TrmB
MIHYNNLHHLCYNIRKDNSMKNILRYLEQLDFSHIEAKVYLTLLNSGGLSVAELAKVVKLNRSAAYTYIYSLLDKGIIAEVMNGPHKQFVATEPERLHYLIEKKKNSLERIEETFPDILTSIRTSSGKGKNNGKEDIKYYKNKNGVKAIYEECLKAKEIRAYYSNADIENVFPENFQIFFEAFQKNPGLTIYEICEDSPNIRKQIKLDRERQVQHLYKLLPQDMKLTANDILIYNGKVSIVNIKDKQNVHGVVLTNQDYYNNSRQLHDLLWKFLPEVK